MKKFLQTNKIKLIILTVLVLCIGTFSSLAIISDETGILTNKFTAGNITTEIEEKIDSDLSKEPSVKNTGKNDCLVRMRVTVSPESNRVSFDYNTAKWNNKDDGFYYYCEAIETGKSTEPLFTKIMIDGKDYSDLFLTDDEDNQYLPDEYKDIINNLSVTLYQEAVQSVIYDSNGNAINDPDQIWAAYDAGLIDQTD